MVNNGQQWPMSIVPESMFSISTCYLEVIGRDCSHQGIISFRRNPAMSSLKVQMTDNIL